MQRSVARFCTSRPHTQHLLAPHSVPFPSHGRVYTSQHPTAQPQRYPSYTTLGVTVYGPCRPSRQSSTIPVLKLRDHSFPINPPSSQPPSRTPPGRRGRAPSPRSSMRGPCRATTTGSRDRRPPCRSTGSRDARSASPTSAPSASSPRGLFDACVGLQCPSQVHSNNLYLYATRAVCLPADQAWRVMFESSRAMDRPSNVVFGTSLLCWMVGAVVAQSPPGSTVHSVREAGNTGTKLRRRERDREGRGAEGILVFGWRTVSALGEVSCLSLSRTPL